MTFVATERLSNIFFIFTARVLYCMAESVERLCIGAVPDWRRLPEDAVCIDDVNALAADYIHAAHAKKAAHSLDWLRRHRSERVQGRSGRWGHILWPYADAVPDIWLLSVNATPPTIGCYLAP